MLNQLFARFDEAEVEYKRNVNMSALSTARVGGIASAVAYPTNDEEFVWVIKLLRTLKIKYKVIGRMSNILPSDNGFDGVLVSTRRFSRISHSDDAVSAECGATLASVISYAARNSLGGAEELFGIPGTVGGAAYSNAGAYGREFSDFFIDGRIYFPSENVIKTLKRREINFGYRESAFSKKEAYLLSSRLRFLKTNAEEIRAKISEIRTKRQLTQPLMLPSLGSTFKRGSFGSAARLIDSLGLKGTSVGGACISSKHAGFIVNVGNATSADFKSLIRLIEDRVFSEYGVALEKEIEYLN